MGYRVKDTKPIIQSAMNIIAVQNSSHLYLSLGKWGYWDHLSTYSSLDTGHGYALNKIILHQKKHYQDREYHNNAKRH
jgi:hypothetical protein